MKSLSFLILVLAPFVCFDSEALVHSQNISSLGEGNSRVPPVSTENIRLKAIALGIDESGELTPICYTDVTDQKEFLPTSLDLNSLSAAPPAGFDSSNTYDTSTLTECAQEELEAMEEINTLANEPIQLAALALPALGFFPMVLCGVGLGAGAHIGFRSVSTTYPSHSEPGGLYFDFTNQAIGTWMAATTGLILPSPNLLTRLATSGYLGFCVNGAALVGVSAKLIQGFAIEIFQ